MSILYLSRKRKRTMKIGIITVLMGWFALLFMIAFFPGVALAGGVGDVVTGVANSNFQSPEFEFGAEEVTGYGFKMHAAYGGYGNGYGGVSVLGPVDSSDMSILLSYVDGEAQHTSIQTTRMKGCEVREYTMADGIGVGVLLPDYFMTAEIYKSGNRSSTDFQKAKSMAQQVLDGMERNGLLSQPAPDIEKPAEERPAEVPAISSVVTGKPLDEAVPVSNVMNIAGVHNGPTVPTTFNIGSAHLVTYILTYHWNNARGATPGTIALQDNKGKVYGPWQVAARPGQGGVPNAYWEVFPNIVIPAGTYTVVDSDPATWSQNAESGGRGMGEVKATPHFEVTSGSVDDLTKGKPGKSPVGSGWKESPAGVGSVGNIPGPSNTTEAVVGVAVPGLIATGLGTLAGLGGGGGFIPPGRTPVSPGGGTFPGAGGAGSGAGAQPTGAAAQEINQLGRRRRNEEVYVVVPASGSGYMPEPDYPRDEINEDIFIDTADIFEDRKNLTGGTRGKPADNGLIIDTADEAAIFVQPEPGIIIDTDKEGAGIIKPDSGMIVETADEAGVLIQTEQTAASPLADTADTGILIDTSALDETGPVAETTIPEPKAEMAAQTPESAAGTESQIGNEGANQDYEEDLAGIYDKDGFDKEGFNKEGFDKAGFDREGFNKAGFDAEGFDKAGFNQAGFDKEGYGRNGFNSEGFDREGFDVNGYNAKGYNRSGYNSQGYDAAGYDKEGFDREGWDAEGYGRDGLNKAGFDREGYDKAGYDKDGYDREGCDREGLQREGYDEYGYDKKGFNKDGFDKDGFDREGFNYEGYNRSGYDPWGYDRQGYGEDGYHWSGYNADGYNRDGRHWSENPFEGDGNPFNVATPDPFGEKEIIPFGAKWAPTKPKLGEPYPGTVEKYGAKRWTNEPPQPEVEKPAAPTPDDAGVIGPEDPMNTLKNHGIDKDAPTAPEANDGISVPAGEGETSGTGLSIPEEDIPETGDLPQDTIPGGQAISGPQHGDTKILIGKDGKEYVLDYNSETGEWENLLTGGKVPNENLESYVEDFERWQDDLAIDRERTAIDMEKMSSRQDANSKAIDDALGNWKKLEQMQKAADKYGIGEKGGPGDVDQAIQDLKDDMLAGKQLDQEKVDKIRRVIDNRIMGKTTADTGQRWEQDPWYKDIDSALKANAAMAKEVVTGEKEDGSISWLGMGARIMITAATGGGVQIAGQVMGTVAMDGALTIAEAMYRIKDSIDRGESDFQAVSKAIGLTVLGEEIGCLAGAAGGQLTKEMLERFPVLTNKTADFVEKGLLNIMKLDQIASRGLGLVGKEGAEETLKQINKRLTEFGGDVAEEAVEKAAKGVGRGIAGSGDDIAQGVGKAASGSGDDVARGVGKTASGSGDDIAKGRAGDGLKAPDGPDGPGKSGTAAGDGPGEPGRPSSGGADDAAGAPGRITPEDSINRGARTTEEVMSDPAAVAKAEKTVQNNIKDFDKMPPAKQQELVREQAVYDEYKLQAEEKTWNIADKVQRGEELTLDDVLEMKADPASMRTLKRIEDVDGLGAELGTGGSRQVQTEFNNVLNERVYQPSYRDVREHLSSRYKGSEIRVEPVRTPGSSHNPWDINTDNDIIALRQVNGPNGPEWVEIPKAEWEDVYYKAYAQNTGFNVDDAARRFPDKNWASMPDDAARYREWANLHEETPMDVFDPEAARDFSGQRTWIIRDGDLPGRPMIQPTPDEIARGIETATIDGKQMRPSSAYELARRGEGKLLDSEQLGMMEKYKVNEYWNKGGSPTDVMRNQTESMEQLSKTATAAQGLENSYRDMGYKIESMPDNMQQAIEAVKDNSLSPAARAARLQELGYDTPGDFVEKLTSRMGAIRTARR